MFYKYFILGLQFYFHMVKGLRRLPVIPLLQLTVHDISIQNQQSRFISACYGGMQEEYRCNLFLFVLNSEHSHCWRVSNICFTLTPNIIVTCLPTWPHVDQDRQTAWFAAAACYIMETEQQQMCTCGESYDVCHTGIIAESLAIIIALASMFERYQKALTDNSHAVHIFSCSFIF